VAELVTLEEEAVMLEGRLLEEGGGKTGNNKLPFNFSSYVARLPLAAAIQMVHLVRRGLWVNDLGLGLGSDTW
jgi:hypothetical protein